MRTHHDSWFTNPGRRGRLSTMLKGLEPLESRNLMAVTVTGINLSNDTGVSSADKITSVPAVAGTTTGSPPPLGLAQVQFDHNNDGTAEGTANVSGSSFSYNPLANDSALASWEGAFTIKYRTRELDGYGSVVSVGDWQSFNMTLDRVSPTNSGLSGEVVYENAEDSEINLNNAMADGVTPDSLLTYQVISNSRPQLFDSVSVNSSGELILDYAEDEYGSANIGIRVTDQAGNYRDVNQGVTVNPVFTPPTIHDFTVTDLGGGFYNFSGWVEDEESMDGNLVWIYVDPDIYFSAIIEEDGSFSVSQELEDPGSFAAAWTFDDDEEMSDTVFADVT